MKPALGEVMDKDMHTDFEEKIRVVSTKVEGVLDIDKCNIRKSGIFYFIDIHVIVDRNISVLEGHAIGHALKAQLMKEYTSIADVLTHVEPSRE